MKKTFVSYLCWGLVLMILPIYLGFKPVLVDRVVYRICRKMGLGQGSKEEFVAQINRMGECATNK